MKLKFLTALLVAALSLGAQTQPLPAAGGADDRCSVTGGVFNGATGEPLRKATILLRRVFDGPIAPGRVGLYTAVTDAQGKYAIAGIGPGKYRVTADHSGFVPQQYGARAPGLNQAGTTLELAPAQNKQGVDLRLTLQGVITGRVIDEDGDPVPNVMVSCLRQAYVRGHKQYVQVQSYSTNDLGEFRIFGIAPGRYGLMATYRPGGWNDNAADAAGGEETYPATYYPGVSAPEMAALIEVGAGSVARGLDIRLQKARAVRVSGRVVSAAAGGSVRSTSVRLVPRSELGFNPMGLRSANVVDEDGKFAIAGVTPGSYWLVAETRQPGLVAARVPVQVGTASIEDAVLTLASAADLNGKFNLAGCEGVKLTALRVVLEPRDTQSMAVRAPAAQALEDGSFVLKSVSPDAYNVRVFGGPNACYLKTARFADAELTDSVLDLSQGIRGGELALSLSAGAGTIDGTVENEKQLPAGPATVVLVPEGSRREQLQYYATTSTGPDGRFSLMGLVPGEYRIYAFDQLEPGAYQDPDFMKPFESRGEKAIIQENGHLNLPLRIILSN